MILVIGGSGQLGSALLERLERRTDVLSPSRTELDVLDGERTDAYFEAVRPSVVINCTAFHNVDQCERTPEPAFAANALAVDRMAASCARLGAEFATISTDYVFDGALGRAYDENDHPNPLTAYGASKLAGELLVRRHGPRHFIFRTSGVYGKSGTSNKGYTFIERVLQQAERGEPVRIVDDMIFSPSYAPHIARVMLAAIDASAFGTHHVAGGGSTSWFAFARRAFDLSGLEPDLTPLSYASFDSPVRRPLYSPLVSSSLAVAGIESAPPWEAGLDAFLAERANRLASVPSL